MRQGAAMGKIRVGILGATGTVGQRFLQLLERHPRFSVTALAASDRSQGKPYAAACAWRLPGAVPDAVRDLVVQAPEPPLDCDVVFSSLPSDVAGSVETRFARAGYRVVTNSSPHRMDDAVPLLIPEVNPDQLALLDACKATGGGFIVANPNCSTVMIALALAPLAARFGVAAVAVTTLQAISGAGYPGVAALDITDNVIPFIAEEEEKIERETRKILGSPETGRVTPAEFAVSAQCHRVNVVDGHLAAVRVKLARAAEPAELREAFASFTGCSPDSPTTSPNPVLTQPEANAMAEVVATDAAALSQGATFDAATGVPFAVDPMMGAPAMATSSATCTPTRSPSPPVNSDGDPVPDSVRVDFAGCTTSRGSYTATLSGTIDLVDPTPVTTDRAVRIRYTDFARSVTNSATGSTRSAVGNGVRSAVPTADQVQLADTMTTEYTFASGTTASHVRKWLATFTADQAGSIQVGSRLPSGDWTIAGASTYTSGTR